MRDFIETDTHRQCCYPRCKKMVKKSKEEKRIGSVVAKFGSIASLCKKHLRESHDISLERQNQPNVKEEA